MNMRFAAPCDKSVFETLPLKALEFSLQNKLKKSDNKAKNEPQQHSRKLFVIKHLWDSISKGA